MYPSSMSYVRPSVRVPPPPPRELVGAHLDSETAEMLQHLQVACHASLHRAKNPFRNPGLFQVHTAGEFQVQPE